MKQNNKRQEDVDVYLHTVDGVVRHILFKMLGFKLRLVEITDFEVEVDESDAGFKAMQRDHGVEEAFESNRFLRLTSNGNVLAYSHQDRHVPIAAEAFDPIGRVEDYVQMLHWLGLRHDKANGGPYASPLTDAFKEGALPCNVWFGVNLPKQSTGDEDLYIGQVLGRAQADWLRSAALSMSGEDRRYALQSVVDEFERFDLWLGGFDVNSTNHRLQMLPRTLPAAAKEYRDWIDRCTAADVDPFSGAGKKLRYV